MKSEEIAEILRSMRKQDPATSEKHKQILSERKAAAREKREKKLTKAGKPRKNSRDKGNTYELYGGDRFAVWWGCPNPTRIVERPIKGGGVAKVTLTDRVWFCRSPGSGGWSRRHAPGDLVVPPDFPYLIEFKNREEWEFDQIIKGTKAGTSEVMGWWREAQTAFADARRLGSPLQDLLMVFTRNRQPDYVMLDLESLSRVELLHEIPGRKFHFFPGDARPVAIMLLDDWFKIPPDVIRVAYGTKG